ncbi:MAG: EF-hand domain-containing protein [Pseudomonadota bacterium]
MLFSVVLATLAGGAAAQDGRPNPGPSLPPHLRNPTTTQAPASGQALRNEAMQKLKRRFDEADLDANGSLTREEAQRGGLGYVFVSFDEIDSAGRGKVSFDDVKKFMQQRRK